MILLSNFYYALHLGRAVASQKQSKSFLKR